MLSWIKGFTGFIRPSVNPNASLPRHEVEPCSHRNSSLRGEPHDVPTPRDDQAPVSTDTDRQSDSSPSAAAIANEPATVFSYRIRVAKQTFRRRAAITDATAPIQRSTSLSSLHLGSKKQVAKLNREGISTAGDLLACSADAFRNQPGFGARACRAIRSWQAAIRLQREVPALTLTAARQLIAVHRMSRDDLARALPGRLSSDLRRLAQASTGSQLFQKSPPPSREIAQQWILSAKQHQENTAVA